MTTENGTYFVPSYNNLEHCSFHAPPSSEGFQVLRLHTALDYSPSVLSTFVSDMKFTNAMNPLFHDPAAPVALPCGNKSESRMERATQQRPHMAAAATATTATTTTMTQSINTRDEKSFHSDTTRGRCQRRGNCVTAFSNGLTLRQENVKAIRVTKCRIPYSRLPLKKRPVKNGIHRSDNNIRTTSIENNILKTTSRQSVTTRVPTTVINNRGNPIMATTGGARQILESDKIKAVPRYHHRPSGKTTEDAIPIDDNDDEDDPPVHPIVDQQHEDVPSWDLLTNAFTDADAQKSLDFHAAALASSASSVSEGTLPLCHSTVPSMKSNKGSTPRKSSIHAVMSSRPQVVHSPVQRRRRRRPKERHDNFRNESIFSHRNSGTMHHHGLGHCPLPPANAPQSMLPHHRHRHPTAVQVPHFPYPIRPSNHSSSNNPQHHHCHHHRGSMEVTTTRNDMMPLHFLPTTWVPPKR